MLTEGRAAPQLELSSDAGEPVRLSALRGRPAVVCFYLKDDSLPTFLT